MGKAILKDIAGRRGKTEDKEEMDVGGGGAPVSAARMRADSDGDEDDDEEEGIGRRSHHGKRELEPTNLTFDTP